MAEYLFLVLACSGSLIFALVGDGEQLDFKNESGPRPNVGARAAVSISQIGWNEELPLRTDRHKLKRLGPSFDHSSDGERGRLPTLVAAVELGAVDQRAAIVADHGIARGGLRPCACGHDLVLQPAGQCDYAFFTFVSGEKSVAFFLVAFRGLLHLGLLLLVHLFLHFSHHGLSFLLGEQRLAAGETISQASDEDRGIERDRLLLKTLAHSFCRIHSEGIAELVLLGFQNQRSRCSFLCGSGGMRRPRWSLRFGRSGRGWGSWWSRRCRSLLRQGVAQQHPGR